MQVVAAGHPAADRKIVVDDGSAASAGTQAGRFVSVFLWAFLPVLLVVRLYRSFMSLPREEFEPVATSRKIPAVSTIVAVLCGRTGIGESSSEFTFDTSAATAGKPATLCARWCLVAL